MKFGEPNSVRLLLPKTESCEMLDMSDVKNLTVKTHLHEKKRCSELQTSKEEQTKIVKSNEISDFELTKYNLNEEIDQIFVKECFMKFLKFQIKHLIFYKRQIVRKLIDEIGMNGFNCLRMM